MTEAKELVLPKHMPQMPHLESREIDPVAPGVAKTYNWKITKKQGPTENELACKSGAYYSTVDKVCSSHVPLVSVKIHKHYILTVFNYFRRKTFTQVWLVP